MRLFLSRIAGAVDFRKAAAFVGAGFKPAPAFSRLFIRHAIKTIKFWMGPRPFICDLNNVITRFENAGIRGLEKIKRKT
jgi:hypothetical protein